MTPADTEYREHVQMVEQHLNDAHKGHRPPVARAESLAEAQVHATLALAAATLLAAEGPERRYEIDTVEVRDLTGRFSSREPLPPPPQLPGEVIEEYVGRLNESLEVAQLARIQAQNPDIDMERVKDHRRSVRAGQTDHTYDGIGECVYGCEDTLR